MTTGWLKRLRIAVVLLVVSLSLHAPAFAVEPDEILADPALESRAREITAVLRCVVCQSQSIDESDAEIAKDMRVLVRKLLTDGKSDKEVVRYIVDRYGSFVLLEPPFQTNTLPLWLGPPAMVVIAAVVVLAFIRSRRRNRSRQN